MARSFRRHRVVLPGNELDNDFGTRECRSHKGEAPFSLLQHQCARRKCSNVTESIWHRVASGTSCGGFRRRRSSEEQSCVSQIDFPDPTLAAAGTVLVAAGILEVSLDMNSIRYS